MSGADTPQVAQPRPRRARKLARRLGWSLAVLLVLLVAAYLTRQSTLAAESQERFLATGEKTCIDCHKGIAHKLPDMSGIAALQ